jgi:hypothetical protein
VANKIIEGKQCNILWHVNDLKLSHVLEQVLDELIADMNKCYGKIIPLTITKGTKHDYLGMTLDYSMPGEVSVWMITCKKSWRRRQLVICPGLLPPLVPGSICLS